MAQAVTVLQNSIFSTARLRLHEYGTGTFPSCGGVAAQPDGVVMLRLHEYSTGTFPSFGGVAGAA